MKVLVANPGTGVYVMETVRAYKEFNNLSAFYSTFVSNINFPFYSKFKGSSIGLELGRRAIDDDIIPFVKTNPFREILRTFSSKFFNEKITDTIYEWTDYGFDRWVASQLNSKIDVVHCYEHSSLATIKRAKELDIFVVYEQPSQHHSFLSPIIIKQFNTNKKLGNIGNSLLLNNKSIYRNKRRDEELALADLIICNSTFTKNTLLNAGILLDKIKVVPLAFPSIKKRHKIENNKLRFIYAGTSNIRKGIHLLLDVWKKEFANRNDVELYVVGRFDLPEIYKEEAPQNVVFIDSVPRNQLIDNFCDADVLILPTLADGFGMVITEAMSRGLCVMCTDHSAGPDIINNGVDGLIFEANNTNSLSSILNTWSTKKVELKKIADQAILKAYHYQWANYRENLVLTIRDAFNASK